ncbi:hypothetical protein BDDG_09280 [Blastomyces dermatitidis ATCC 18188]|uniref:Uncharacterized protein n=1 Tax=Ajellomyces dermatitidis (strain ATCC 18188 / CBS 674.68) TaxID=653446 RepID=F2TSX2_AJEDA|nr:hypothetical protein BDDG_09280 [Blastomyces dermatitidis ATCC 18188]
MREKLQIELLKVTVSEIKLSPGFSLNDHTESYITVLAERGGSVVTAVREMRNEMNTDKPTDRRDNISLQDTVTTAVAVKEVGEEEDVIMRAVLSQLIDTAVFTFNLAFLTVMEATAAS